jgi:hypothetical protein
MSLPSPLWNEEDEELWLNQKVVEPMEVQQVTKAVQTKPVRFEKRRVEEQPIASPKVFSPGGGVSITFGGSNR